MAATRFCYDTNRYCNNSIVPLANFCTIFFGTTCNFPCSENHCQKEIIEFVDCTGNIFWGPSYLWSPSLASGDLPRPLRVLFILA